MAFQIDPNIPLQAQRTTFDPASILMQAQQNGAALEKHRFEMQRLREQYDAEKEARKQQKAMQMGIASELAGIQKGTPAQYAPMTYRQTPQTGQMPQGMTGVLRSEQGQNLSQPKAFGEDILAGNFELGGGEVTREAVAGREPVPIDFLKSAFKQAMLARDYDNAFKFQKAIQESEKSTNEYYGGLTEGIDPKTGQSVLLAMTKTGAVPSGYSPKPKDGKAVPVIENGVPKTVKVPNTNEVKILMSDGTLMSGGSIPAPPAPEKPMTKYQKIQLEGGLRDDYRKDSANFVEISRQAKIIEASLNDPSSAATLASATAFMKMLDPESVVRESELAMAMNTTGKLDKLDNYFNVIRLGQVLTENQKRDFGRLIKEYQAASNQAQRNLNKKYSQISSEYGLDPKRVAVYDVEKEDKPAIVNATITGKTKIVKTRADLDKVKSGESYIAPDGKLWVKP
jgi:hypothetical protein